MPTKRGLQSCTALPSSMLLGTSTPSQLSSTKLSLKTTAATQSWRLLGGFYESESDANYLNTFQRGKQELGGQEVGAVVQVRPCACGGQLEELHVAQWQCRAHQHKRERCR